MYTFNGNDQQDTRKKLETCDGESTVRLHVLCGKYIPTKHNSKV